MTDERVASHLDAIFEAAAGAPEAIAGLTRVTFLSDRRGKLAATMTLVVIGEAAARILSDFPDYAAAHPEVPWADIRGIRNRGVHGYDNLNFEIVWDTVTIDLPVLASQVSELLAEFGGPLPPEPPQTGT